MWQNESGSTSRHYSESIKCFWTFIWIKDSANGWNLFKWFNADVCGRTFYMFTFPVFSHSGFFFFFPDNDSWIKTCNILCLKTKCSLNIEEESIKHLHVTILHKTVGCAAYMCSQKGPVLHHLLWTELHFKRHSTCHQLEERLFYLQRNANLQSVRADLFIRSWQSLVQLSGDT